MKFNILFFVCLLMLRSGLTMVNLHFKCRGGLYPRSKIERFPVPDDKVDWNTDFKQYSPVNHTASSIIGQPWADIEIDDKSFNPKWNSLDGNVNRASYTGKYSILKGYPLNPMGRTGISGRGVLGRWGPNHAGDPVVTRWKRNTNGQLEKDSDKRPILQFIAVKRRDTGEWALPGGMVDPGEKVTQTAVREFQEEAMNSLEMKKDELETWKKKFTQFFSEGTEVYKGYVDDPRNTDNAWMETAAYNFHDEDGSIVGTLNLKAGDDAVGVQWVDIIKELNLYGSHKEIVDEVLKSQLIKSNS